MWIYARECLQKPEEGAVFSGAEIKGGWELLTCVGTEQRVPARAASLLTAESSLQPGGSCCWPDSIAKFTPKDDCGLSSSFRWLGIGTYYFSALFSHRNAAVLLLLFPMRKEVRDWSKVKKLQWSAVSPACLDHYFCRQSNLLESRLDLANARGLLHSQGIKSCDVLPLPFFCLRVCSLGWNQIPGCMCSIEQLPRLRNSRGIQLITLEVWGLISIRCKATIWMNLEVCFPGELLTYNTDVRRYLLADCERPWTRFFTYMKL